MKSDVEFKNVNKTYDNGHVAVDSLNLKIKDGEFLVLLGPSGCGKSTTLRMLAGLESVTHGEILIGGTKVNDLPAGSRNLGMVFQSYALYPHMTIKNNLSFGLRMASKSERLSDEEIEHRVMETSEMLGLTPMLASKPKSLSGGQRQRVAIGRALVRQPKVLLMDEPLSNLDAKLRNKMRIELRRLHELHGTTTVYVTHDQVEAMTLADRIAIIANSKLQQHSSPLDAYHQPNNTFVASFLGSPAMNLIEGTIEKDNFIYNDVEFQLPEHLKNNELKYGTFGIRPENIRFVEHGGVKSRIEAVERLGDQTVVHLNVSGAQITALIQATNNIELLIGKYINISLAEPSALIFND